jgi:HEAT repeat protein
MRWLVSLGLGICCLSAATAGEFGGKTTAEWLKILKENKELKPRRAALIALEVIGARAGVVEGLTAALQGDPDAEIRRETALVLGRIDPVEKSKSAVAPLGEVLASSKEDAAVREAAAVALGGKLAPFAGSQVLILGRALKDKHAPVVAAAAEALKNMREKAREAYPDLLALVQGPKAEIVARRFAMHALSRFPDLTDTERDAILTALNAAASESDVGLRESALDGLGHLKSEKALPGFVAGLKAKEPELRRAALRGLAQLKEKAKGAWSAVKPALADEDSAVRNQAILICGLIGKAEPEAVKELIQALQKDRDQDNRLTAIQALGGLGGAAVSAVDALERVAAGDVRAKIRDAAKEALRKIKG